jgi:MATE family multidrug resistance protein
LSSARFPVHVEAWRLAWPLILSNLSYPLLGVVDTAVVGHLAAPHYLGAVAIGALTISVLYFVLGFLRMSTTGLTAQAFGRGDGVELRAGLLRSLLLAQLLALVLLLLGGWLVPLTAVLFRPSAEVAPELATYLRIGLRGAPAALTNLVLLGWMLGLQNARGPMLLLIVTNALNAALDLAFVLGLGLGVGGVAWATVAAQYGGLAFGIWLVRGELRAITGGWPWRARSTATSSCAA